MTKNNILDKNDFNIQNIDVPQLIRTNQYYQYISLVKNYEDTIQKIFSNQKKSQLTNDPLVYLYEINKTKNNDLFPNVRDLDLKLFENIFDISKMNDVVIIGPYVRSHLIKHKDSKIRNELYLYRCDNNSDNNIKKWKELVNLESFVDEKTEYIYQDETKRICLIKKKYCSPAHVIIQHDYMKRIGWMNGNYYVSSMFLVEFQKHISLMESGFMDPIMKIYYDPLQIYLSPRKSNNHITDTIETVDYEEITKFPTKYFDKLYNLKTCIELCMDKYIENDHPMIQMHLKQMILYLANHKYRRPPYMYAKMIGMDKMHDDLFVLLLNIPNLYDINSELDFVFVPKSLHDINNLIIEYLISQDSSNDLIDFLTYIKQKINKNLLNMIINKKANKILSDLISNKILDQGLSYYACLMIQNLELVELLDPPFDIEIGVNYLKDILENGLTRSFYYLVDMDSTILGTRFEDNQNVLHQMKAKGNYKDMVHLILKLEPDLINLPDNNGETPLVFHSKNNPELLIPMLDFECDPTIWDTDGNTLIHHLCKSDRSDILKVCIKRFLEIIDLPNKNFETPTIIACQNNQEDVFYLLKSMGASMNIKDKFGNTVYHYICSNSMCLGMMITNYKNYFGLTPYDYCKLSPKYYNFVEPNC